MNGRSNRWTKAALMMAVASVGTVDLACDAAPDTGADPEASGAVIRGATEAERVRSYLDSKYRREDVRHAFKTRFKEDIDCIDARAQPALKHPLLRNHVIAEPPPRPHAAAPSGALAPPVVDGTFDEAGNQRRCPPGTVPVVRETEESIRRAGGLDNVRRHASGKHAPPAGSGVTPPSSAGYVYAIGVNQTLPSSQNLGSARLAIYNPIISSIGDHLISQTWLLSQGRDSSSPTTTCASPNCTQSLEAGWNVDIGLYGDGTGGEDDNGYTHFFIFSTQDGYTVTGCYNLAATCAGWGHGTAQGSGFVMYSGATYTPGQIIGASFPGGNPVAELALEWFQPGPGLGNNWWLFANGTPVGYVPGSLFANGQGGTQNLTQYAYYYLAGGEVYDSAPSGLPTLSDMGSGRFAATGFTQSAYQRNLLFAEDSNDGTGDEIFHNASISPFVTDAARYSESTAPAAGGSGWNTYFYFGGPGRTP